MLSKLTNIIKINCFLIIVNFCNLFDKALTEIFQFCMALLQCLTMLSMSKYSLYNQGKEQHNFKTCLRSLITQSDAEIACINGMWQLGITFSCGKLKRHISSIVFARSLSISNENKAFLGFQSNLGKEEEIYFVRKKKNVLNTFFTGFCYKN